MFWCRYLRFRQDFSEMMERWLSLVFALESSYATRRAFKDTVLRQRRFGRCRDKGCDQSDDWRCPAESCAPVWSERNSQCRHEQWRKHQSRYDGSACEGRAGVLQSHGAGESCHAGNSWLFQFHRRDAS